MTRHTTRVDGIDVARYQKLVDWPTVRANIAGPGFAAWKVSQGTASRDPYRDINRAGTRKAGFRWRVGYHWLTPLVDPIQQADWFLSNFFPEPDEGVMLDAEEDHRNDNPPGPCVSEAEVLAWCQHVEARIQRPVTIVYTGVGVSGGTIWRSTKIYNGQRLRFLAAYISEARVRAAAQPYGFDAWQGDGGATGTFPGVNGPCDLDMVEHPIMFDLACGITAATPTYPHVPQEEEMRLLTNGQPRDIHDGAGVRPAQQVYYKLHDDDTVEHIPGTPHGIAVLNARGGTAAAQKTSNADLDALGAV